MYCVHVYCVHVCVLCACVLCACACVQVYVILNPLSSYTLSNLLTPEYKFQANTRIKTKLMNSVI